MIGAHKDRAARHCVAAEKVAGPQAEASAGQPAAVICVPAPLLGTGPPAVSHQGRNSAGPVRAASIFLAGGRLDWKISMGTINTWRRGKDVF
ncbi:hypothetical protein WJX73_007992 [Symbiochloris irregularis]|uniref:Uncharacterized protein n=1 Tax=Symbiochloris irregularis TaxID=706552 RepID=A0AAW1PI74_9CHLO